MKGIGKETLRRFYDGIVVPCAGWLGKPITILTVKMPNWVIILAFIILAIGVWKWGPECVQIFVEHLGIDSAVRS